LNRGCFEVVLMKNTPRILVVNILKRKMHMPHALLTEVVLNVITRNHNNIYLRMISVVRNYSKG
jgi:hypothetical protein